MYKLTNIIKTVASVTENAGARPRFGLVTSVDAVNATARVMLQPEGVLSGWLPVLSQWVGNGWGAWCPPTPGDQVLVLAQEGDAEHGVIVGRAFSASDPPPPAAVGEVWLVHATGSALRLRNSGTVEIIGPVAVAGTITVTGDLIATGNLIDQHGSLAALRDHYNLHIHQESNGSSTSTTSQPD
ncbi:MAG: phage baseplate assembly protein V [Acetobacteraceae bacterium]